MAQILGFREQNNKQWLTPGMCQEIQQRKPLKVKRLNAKMAARWGQHLCEVVNCPKPEHPSTPTPLRNTLNNDTSCLSEVESTIKVRKDEKGTSIASIHVERLKATPHLRSSLTGLAEGRLGRANLQDSVVSAGRLGDHPPRWPTSPSHLKKVARYGLCNQVPLFFLKVNSTYPGVQCIQQHLNPSSDFHEGRSTSAWPSDLKEVLCGPPPQGTR